MGTITILCPRTGQRVSTGLVMTPEEFARAPLRRNILRCPACGRAHEWSKDVAELRDDDPAPQPPAPKKN